MIYIARLKMRGFKSFKFADIIFPKDFVCLAGPNGSGKSNICDAIRFAFGEISLKNLRAKKAKELICQNAKMAEVTVYIDGDEKHEIKRAIRDDGKMLYRLDGERTTRASILDLLKRYNIDDSGRNTIAQGEVNRIVNMSPKSRREIIDSVAGISEFEDKKKEAMNNLEIVETRIREANLVLGEKIGMLNELEKEREVALKYIENRKLFNNARGSIVKKEIAKYTEEMEKAIIDMEKIANSLKNKRLELARLEEIIRACERDKSTYLSEIQARQQKSELTKAIDAFKISIGKDEQELEEKRKLVAKFELDIKTLKEELALESEGLKKKEAELKKTESEYNQLKSQCEVEMHVVFESEKRKMLDADRARLASMREERGRIEGEYAASEQLVLEKERSLDILSSDNSEREQQLESEIEILRKEISEAKAEMDLLFEKEKQANADIADMERRSLSVREKIAALKAQNPRFATSAVMEFINKYKDKNSGIYGALIDLISFEPKYANAIEAAAGQRLLYVVVSDANVATKLINKIKEASVGRTTLIPLKEVKTSVITSFEGLGPLSHYLKFDAKIEKAVEYAFGETLLVSNMEEAKKIGIGKYRMVTLEGEIFEKSGVITGGKISTGIAATRALSKLNSELGELKSARESVYLELTRIREQMSSMRTKRMEKEVRLKSLEVELSAMKSEDEKRKKEREKIAKQKEEIAALRVKIKTLSAKKTELDKEITLLSDKITKDELSLAAEEEYLAKQNEEAGKKRAELAAKIAALEAKRDALLNELELRKTNLRKSELKLKQMNEERASYLSKISELERRLTNQKNELLIKEKELIASNEELQAYFDKTKEIEQKIQELGKQRGVLSYECEKLSKDHESINLKRVSAETRLVDLKAELDSFRDFEFIDKPKEELLEMSKVAEAFLLANQTVNLASIELYEKKKAEIGDVRDRLQHLEVEKGAIIKMIGEIDMRKKETFFNTFYAVNDNFRKMFRHIPQVGEGFLYLDKPSDPFNSGLYLRIKRGTKEIGTESLSGGEISLITLMFIFALQFVKPSPYYVLDEVDSALDKENSKNLAKLIKEMSKNSQFVIVTHNDTVMMFASAVFGVSKTGGISKVVGVKLEQKIGETTQPEVIS